MRYSEHIQSHFREPRNVGALDAATHRASESNPVCGDFMTLSLRIEEDTITEAAFLAEGCVPTHAMGSLLTEALRGLNLETANAMTVDDMLAMIGPLPPGKEHVAHLAVSVLKAALRSTCQD